MKRCLSVQFFFFLEMVKRDEYIYFMSVCNLRIGLVVFKSMLQGRQEWENGEVFAVSIFFLQCIFVYFYSLLATPTKLVFPLSPHQNRAKKKNKKKKEKKQKEVRGCDTVFNEHY